MMSGEIIWTIDADDIEWEYEQGDIVFNHDKAVAHLILNEVVWAAHSLSVCCSDVFAWACADSEPLPFNQIETLYKMWRRDLKYGPEVWCMIQRKQMPQAPVEKSIREASVWNLDALGLAANTTDAQVHALVASVAAEK